MIRPLRLLALPLLVTSFALSAFAQAPAPAIPALTLEECVARALGKNFDLQVQQFTTDSAKESVSIAKATYEPTFSLSSSIGQAKSATQSTSTIIDANGNAQVVVQPSSRSETSDIRAGVSQKIVTGATVSASTSIDRSKRTPASSLLNPAYDSDVTLSVSQPLLKGGGLAANRAALQRSKLGLERAQLDFKAAVLDVVRNVEAAYFNLGFAREQLAVRRFSLEVAQRLLDENRDRRTSGVSTDLDVLQAEVGVANARRNILTAEQTVRDREDALLALIGQFEFTSSLGSIAFGDFAVPAVSFDRSYAKALANSPDFASTRASIEQLKLDTLVAKNNARPSVALGGAVGLNHRDDSWGDAGQEAFSRDGYSWQADLSISMPWGLRADKARLSQARLSQTREELRLRQIDQNLLVDVRAAVRAVETNAESVTISSKATELSQRQYELEEARFKAGVSTFRRVQEAQEDWDSARISELQARINLRIALADLARLEASSLEHYKIALQTP